MSFKRFIQILFSGQIAAMNPSQWPDQYELYWLKCLQSEKGKKEFDDYIKGLNNDKINKEWTKKSATELCDLTYKKCYAICYTESRDSELMWRAYSDNNKSIMISTTEDKVRSLGNNYSAGYYYLKEIQYDLEERGSFTEFLERMNIYPGSVGYDDFDEWFLHKRKCFNYEEEVRLVVLPDDLNARNGEIIMIDIPVLSDFIDEVMVNPLAKDEHVELTNKICTHFGIPFQGRSRIYDFERE